MSTTTTTNNNNSNEGQRLVLGRLGPGRSHGLVDCGDWRGGTYFRLYFYMELYMMMMDEWMDWISPLKFFCRRPRSIGIEWDDERHGWI
mmetsp:Transcript_13218/g.36527  ORF Transcript_13218/g.36527 Transcript_13218/m.36527 type:complete len:89 (+) Transcript_13218:93-359(+)